MRLLVRDRRRAERAGLPAADTVETSLEGDGDRRALDAAVEDAEVVLHLAGAVRAWPPSALVRSNVVATATLLAALPPTARFVLVSSLAAAGPSADGAGTGAPPSACRPCSRYGESKRRGELALLADAGRTGRSWLVLRPGLVYGAGDGATALLFRQATQPLCLVPRRPRPLSTLHVDDLCDALVAAIERADLGGRFLPLGGEATDTHTLMRELASARGRRARLCGIPDALIHAAGMAADLVASVRRRPSYFSRDKAREITAAGWVADPAPAAAALAFAARIGLRRGLSEVVAAGGLGTAAP